VFTCGRLAGWYSIRRAQLEARRPILAELDRLGAHYYYDYQLLDADTAALADEGSPQLRKHWLAPIFGRDWFHDVFYVTFAKFDSHRKDGAVATQQSNIDDRTIGSLVELRGLRWLALTGTGISDSGTKALAAMPSLERLWLSQTKITDTGLKQLGSLSTLTHVSLEATPTSDRGLTYLERLTKLRSLSLGSPFFTPAGLKQLEKIKSLESLYLDRMPVDDSVIEAIGQLKQLHTLSIRQTAITDRGLGALKGLDHLKELHIDGCQISDQSLRAASHWTQLETISFTNTSIGDPGLQFLASCSKIRSIRLAQSGCTLRGVLDLLVGKMGMKLPTALKMTFDTSLDAEGQVVSVNLNSVRISDQDIDLLAELQKLEWLDMQDSEITDAGAARLAELGFPQLRLLKVDNSKITNSGFLAICSLKNLRDLHIRHTGVTSQAIESMRESKPFLRVYSAPFEQPL